MIDIPAFEIARLPRIVFGKGSLMRVAPIAARYGQHVLLITGASSLRRSPHWPALMQSCKQAGLVCRTCSIANEPSPQRVDEIAAQFRDQAIDVVIGIGGGSVLDGAKAIAGLLRVSHTVMDFLEGVGPELPYPGPAVPFIAVPTTAGTGSEATKNAVLSIQGAQGFKKSFRDEKLVPEYAVLDSDLLASCPRPQIAANGMDAFTQLLESHVSSKANPMTDALALSGIRMVRDGLFDWYDDAGQVDQARSAMLYGALLSGITLAQVGLGSVHGLASPLGAFFPIPHGVVCGTLVAICTTVNISALRARAPNHPALGKYARVGKILAHDMKLDDRAGCEYLLQTLTEWTQRLELPVLSHYGMTDADIPLVVANARGSSMKTNPVVLTDEEIAEILLARL